MLSFFLLLPIDDSLSVAGWSFLRNSQQARIQVSFHEGNLSLLSSHSILAAATSLFASVFPFSSLVLSSIIIASTAHAIKQTLGPVTSLSLLPDDIEEEEDNNNNQHFETYSSTLLILQKATRQARGRRKTGSVLRGFIGKLEKRHIDRACGA
jgi:hypothetical protein